MKAVLDTNVIISGILSGGSPPDRILRAGLARTFQIVTSPPLLRELEDVLFRPTDNRLLEAAVAGEADYVVSGDRAVLALSRFEGISIVTPAQFLIIAGGAT